MAWAFLIAAIVLEVTATMSLQKSVTGSRLWYLPVSICYVLAFMGLAAALDYGMELGVGYGIWSATGVAATAILSRVLFKEALTFMMTCGIVLIMGGVLLIEISGA